MTLRRQGIVGLVFGLVGVASATIIWGFRESFAAKSAPPSPVVLQFKSAHVQTPFFNDANKKEALTVMTDSTTSQLLIANLELVSVTDSGGSQTKVNRNAPISENISARIQPFPEFASLCVWRFSISKNAVVVDSENCSYPQGMKGDVYIDYVYR